MAAPRRRAGAAGRRGGAGAARRRPRARARSNAPLPRRLAAWTLSLILSAAGMVVVFFAALMVVVAVVEAAGGERSWGRGVALALVGVAAVAAGVVLIGRVRPWLVAALTGVEVPRVPWLLAAMWNSPYGAYSSGGDAGGGGGSS